MPATHKSKIDQELATLIPQVFIDLTTGAFVRQYRKQLASRQVIQTGMVDVKFSFINDAETQMFLDSAYKIGRAVVSNALPNAWDEFIGRATAALLDSTRGYSRKDRVRVDQIRWAFATQLEVHQNLLYRFSQTGITALLVFGLDNYAKERIHPIVVPSVDPAPMILIQSPLSHRWLKIRFTGRIPREKKSKKV